MYKWTKKLHMYAGLLTFMAFVVWGVAGVAATFLPAPINRQPREPEVHYVEFKADGNANDQQVTNAMIEASGLPFIQQGRKPNRNPQGLLQVRYFHPNGTRLIVYEEKQARLRIEKVNSTLSGFMNTLHMQTLTHHNPGIEAQLWGGYNVISMWAAIFMTLSGVYLWIASRPGLPWAQWTFGISTAAVVAMYFVLR